MTWIPLSYIYIYIFFFFILHDVSMMLAFLEGHTFLSEDMMMKDRL